MEELIQFTPERLEMCTYRYLQQISKKMGLPSNVKKVQLIALIHAKRSRTPEEVESIIQRVKQERLRLSQAKKNRKNRKKIRLQGTEISSTSNSQSPPITITPKRPLAIRYSPECQVIRYKPKSTILDVNKTLIRKTYPSPKKGIGSDRVLRSFNVKATNYGMMNSVIGVIKAPNTVANQETRINIIGQDGRTQRLNVTAFVRKRPVMSNNLALRSEQTLQVPRTVMTSNPIKRQRAISGIYPLKEIPKPSQYMKGVRRQDGRVSQINSYLQRPHYPRNYESEVTVQDLIDSNVSQSLINDEYNFDNHENENTENDQTCSVYYHKKIRSEQVKSQGLKDSDWVLPKINDVFSQFNDVHRRDLCQPIYVQVSEESERLQNYPLYMLNSNVNNTTMIESLYNFKNQFILNHPLLQVATTSNTRCVYSTPTIATPMAQPSHTVVSNEYYQSSYERDSQRQYSADIGTTPRIYDYFRMSEQEALRKDFKCNEVMSTSSSSLETCLDSSQELGANVTIPEMVEDALELISQDGDYMERIGMELRIQCVLCTWAGPGIILEYHIRKDHPKDIHSPNGNECNITFTVGRLVHQQHLWISEAIEYDSVLYILSAKYEDPDWFMLNVTMISQDILTPKYAKITVYNKVTGEPHTWQGEIQPISPSMPYENRSNCLKLELSKLDILPNSANLKLLNRQLVIKSPVKVVVGQPELDNIHVVVFVRFLNYL